MIRITHAALACGALFGAALAVPAPAHAQTVMDQALSGNPSGGINSGADNSKRWATPALPPALPGSSTSHADVAPLQRDPNDMNPTEALFDAVNRGDAAAARAAIGRGADLNAKNILGLTPIDLSVDLGRSDMTFLLLSMRGAAPVGGPAPAAGTAVAAVAAKHPKVTATPLARATPAPRAAAAPQPAPRPRVVASEVAPRPSVGFLGFGSR